MATTIEGVDFSAQITRLLALETWRNNRVVSGLFFSAPTTPSTQESGAVKAVWLVNFTFGIVTIKGVTTQEPTYNAGTGVNVNTEYVGGNEAQPILAVGQSVVCAMVQVHYVYNGEAGVHFYQFYGTPATTGQEQPPSAAKIDSQLADYGGTHVRIAKLTLNRTGDTTVTQSQDNTWRDF